MSEKAFSGGEKLERKLKELGQKVSQPATLQVGFFAEATYPSGTPVALVAAVQEFGAPRMSVPMRPYFRPMIAKRSPTWGKALAQILKSNDYDAMKSLDTLGLGISEQLKMSIIDVNEPPLSPITLMLRKMKSEGGPNFVVTGKIVGEAAARVAAGESYAGVSTKVLDETGHMISSVMSKVKT